MSRRRRRKCHHCGQLYEPDPRNRYHQRYCHQPACRKASKAASQARWRASPKGRDYFRGPANALRVRAWRAAHPGYWRKPDKKLRPLQDLFPPQALVPPTDKAVLSVRALQEVCATHGLLLQGLVAQLTGSALQENIVPATHRLISLGQQIQGPGGRRVFDGDPQATALSGAGTPRARAVQLAGPPAGPG